MKLKLSLKQTTLTICVITIAFEAMFVAKLMSTLSLAENEVQQERTARDVIARVLMVSVEVENAVMGGIRELDLKDPPGSSRYIEIYQHHIDEIFNELATIKDLLKNSPERLPQINKLEQTCKKGMDLMERCRTRVTLEGNPFEGLAATRRVVNQMTQMIFEQTEVIKSSLVKVQEESYRKQSMARRQLLRELSFGLGLNIIAVLIAGTLFNRNISRRLTLLTDNTKRLAVGVPLTPVMDGEDEIAAVDSAFHKMAELLKESSLREREVVENALDLICSIDSKERFVSVNSAANTILGRSPDSLIGSRFIDLVADDDKERALKFFDKVGRERLQGEIELRLLPIEGKSLYLLFSVHWSSDRESFFCVGHDISERRSMERMKQEFMTMVSHDLKTPLTSISGTIELIRSGVIKPDSKFGDDRLADAEGSVKRLIVLVNDLLYLERMESGKLTVKQEPVSIAVVVQRGLESVRLYAEQMGIKFAVNASQLTVMGDEERLVQVLVNLLSNAVKFSAEGAPIDIVSTQSGEFAEIRVIDHGPGMSEADQNLLFDRFKQLDSPDGKHREGTGLGLSICKAIVDAHQGTIGVKSQKGEGSSFWFKIPLAVDETSAASSTAETSTSPTNSTSSTTSATNSTSSTNETGGPTTP